MGVAGGVNLFHLRKQLLKNCIKISHAQSNTNSLEVNENFRISKTKLKQNKISELILNCIAMKLNIKGRLRLKSN